MATEEIEKGKLEDKIVVDGYNKLSDAVSALAKTAICVITATNEFNKALAKIEEAEAIFKLEEKRKRKERWNNFKQRMKDFFNQ